MDDRSTSSQFSDSTSEELKPVLNIAKECQQGNFKPYLYAIHNNIIDDPQKLDEGGYSVIHQVVAFGNISVLRILVEEYKQDPNIQSKARQTPLMISINYCQKPCTTYLLKFSQDINQEDLTKFTAATYAVKQCDWQTLVLLISKGANINNLDANGCTLCHWAAFKNDVFMLKLLARFGLNPAQPDTSSFSPFQRAVTQNCFLSMKYLLDSSYAHYETVKFLENNNIKHPQEDYLPSHEETEKIMLSLGQYMKNEVLYKKNIKEGVYDKINLSNIVDPNFFRYKYPIWLHKQKFIPCFILLSIIFFLWAIFFQASIGSPKINLFTLLFAHVILIYYIYLIFMLVLRGNPFSKILKNKGSSGRSDNFLANEFNTEMDSLKISNSSRNIYQMLQQSNYYISFKDYDKYLQQNNMANYFFETVIEKFDLKQWKDLSNYHKREICPTCLIWKPHKTRHCKRINLCIRDYHLYSWFYGMVITSQNHLTYLLIQIIQTVLLFFMVVVIENSALTRSIFIINPIFMILNFIIDRQVGNLVLYIPIIILAWSGLFKISVEFYCILKNLTWDELYNRHYYYYLYQYEMDGKTRSYMRFKNPNNHGYRENIFQFFKKLLK